MKNFKRLLLLKFARKVNRNSSNKAAPVPTIISENTIVKGDIISDGIVHIDGQVEGDIRCSELIIGLKGAVKGCVIAKNMQLYGALSGKAMVDTLFISKNAKLIGDASHNSIAIEPGAYIDGHCMRSGAPIPAEQGAQDLMLVDKSGKSKHKA